MSGEFKETPYIDYGDFNTLSFQVTKTGAEYNLELHFALYSVDDEYEQGFIQRTSIFSEELPAMAMKIMNIMDSGLYDHLVFVSEAICYNADMDDFTFEFDWEDYFPSRGYIQ